MPQTEENWTDADRKLLTRIQDQLPLTRRPYAQLAEELGSSEQDVLSRLSQMRGDDGIIREIAGLFDARALGYQQALIALDVPAERLDEAGQFVARHPGVSHCYAREGAYGLWFTLAVSPESELGLGRTVDRLAGRTGAQRSMILPTVKRYKLRVRFDLDDCRAERKPIQPEPENLPPSPPPVGPRAEQIEAIRALQIDLPNEPEPFLPLAKRALMDVDDLLGHAREFIRLGWMRRYAAILQHRRAGARCNLLVAWQVPPERADIAGHACAEDPAVSHCYLRPQGPDWPYTLYTMIHARSRDECLGVVEGLAVRTGLADRAELWTRKEYAKRRVRLFSDAEAAWERETL